MVGGHHQLDGHEFEQAMGVDEGQGSLEYCSPLGHKGSVQEDDITVVNIYAPNTRALLYITQMLL